MLRDRNIDKFNRTLSYRKAVRPGKAGGFVFPIFFAASLHYIAGASVLSEIYPFLTTFPPSVIPWYLSNRKLGKKNGAFRHGPGAV